MSVGGSSISQRIQNACGVAGGMLQRAAASQATSTGKAISVNLAPLAPMIIAGSALLYNQGQEATKPDGERGSTLNILLESTLAYLILQYTSGLYTLYGIGMAAYRAGQKPNAQEQLKAVINTAITMSLGYVGVQLLGGMSKTADQMDDHIIYRALRDEQDMMGRSKPKRWLAHLDDRAEKFAFTDADLAAQGIQPEAKEQLETKVKDLFRGVREDLKNLQNKLTEMYPDWADQVTHSPNQAPSASKFKRLSEESLKLKQQIAEKMDVLGKDAYTGLLDENLPVAQQIPGREAKKAAKSLIGNIRNSQSAWTRIVRGLNPICGYMILGLVVGTPVAQWVTSWIGQKRPDLQKKSFQQPLFPPESRVMRPAMNLYGGRGQVGAGRYAPGQPYMVWNGFNEEQPSGAP